MGKIKDDDLQTFDNIFFNIPEKHANYMDPLMRMLMESTYEAIIDAGYNPQELRGSRTGVYIALSNGPAEQYWLDNEEYSTGYALVGTARAMFANRLTFAFDFVGPSCVIDASCASSLCAVSQAFDDLRSNRCDAAFVAGLSLTLKPTTVLGFKHMGMLNEDGKCKSFDANGDGFVNSDACVTMFLQKGNQARRCYSTVLNIRMNTDGYKEEGILFLFLLFLKCVFVMHFEN